MATNIGFTHEPRHSERVEWYTPPHIFEALAMQFDLDPCSAGEGNDFVPATHRFTLEDDGLKQQWHGLVWCNPPYGNQTGDWMQRMANHNNGIALVFARTGTRWWQRYAISCSLICFINGRVRFINGSTGLPASAAGADSALLAWGSAASEAVRRSNLGWSCVSASQTVR